MAGAQAAFLPDGRRLHLQHGPIDLIVDASGADRDAALARAVRRFETLLQELVDELALLRPPVTEARVPEGAVARAMFAAVAPFAPEFVTPMAAVAGAVADEILRVLAGDGGLDTAYVNNGGDVAVHLAPGQSLTAALAGTRARAVIAAASGVRGIATSGWRGRSFSLGIADSVTVLAATAAAADAAATMIANAVDLPGHPAVRRTPARDLAPDSDLGERLVTTGVGPLTADECAKALDRGADFAQACQSRGLIAAAFLSLNGAQRITGAAGMIETDAREPSHA